MRRILLAVLALFVAVSVAGCAKQGGRPDSLAMSSGAVKSAVAGWKVSAPVLSLTAVMMESGCTIRRQAR